MKTKNSFCILAAALLASIPARAEIYNFTVNSAVPDDDFTGMTDVEHITTSDITSIASVSVNLNISGGQNGDLFALLQHHDAVNNTDSSYVILLNRIGRDTGTPNGFTDSGMNIWLSDVASTDVHTGATGAPLTIGSTWQPDGRDVDPASVLTGSARTTFLNQTFQGLNANGDWTLFLADVNSGNLSTLNGWSLDIQGLSGVPEPTNVALAVFGLLLVGAKGGAWLLDRRAARAR